LFNKNDKEVIHIHIPVFITKHKKIIVTVFAVAAVISGFCIPAVAVNYNMADYLPKDSQSTVALEIMDREFSQAVPNARVMLNGVSLTKALEYKGKIKEIEGVAEVLWLDDVISLKEPVEMADQELVGDYYKDNTALLSVTVKEGYEVSATDAIYRLIGENNSLAGDAVNIATSQKLAFSEAVKAFAILVPIILFILFISTQSWIEPFLFLGSIGISVLINMGTNIFFGEVSFMTQAISPILQMAVSLDYAIFLLHSFFDYRRQTQDVHKAMQLAMKRAFPAVIASALTTLFGFVALIFMRFRIGSDLGINLVKGIIFSFISVMVFLPGLTLCCYKMIDRTRHRHILPNFTRSGKVFLKLKIPCLILFAVIILPGFLAQGKNTFMYGFGSISSGSRSGLDEVKISEKFGQSTAIVLLVPKGAYAKEKLLCEELQSMAHIKQVIAYATMVGVTIPEDYLDPFVTGQFYSENYCRIILYTDTPEESDTAFSVVRQVQDKAKAYYGNDVYSCGQSANLLDMKNTIQADAGKVNLIAVGAILLVLLLTFRSISVPLILLLTIEAAIWINLAVPYFYGRTICYIGYLVINTVQLGATVDYAILFTDHYLVLRRQKPKKEAALLTYGETFHSILVSAVILASAGFVVAYTSTNPIVSELGMLLGRGTILSMIMVVCVLPQLLLLFDRVIEKTTLQRK
jgi:predicted RND superfamily exporter protein